MDLREESGRIIIEPSPRKEYALSELLKKITPENLHDQVDFGKPVGGLVLAPARVPDAGDLVWINFDPPAGHEQAGHRPAVVLSPAAYNAKTSRNWRKFAPKSGH